ncbi:MAG: DNA-binding protein [Piptocephalis tieghemiana]|nr:MAG: DNA-binding protein [Piptocephalis tieghemiana]
MSTGSLTYQETLDTLVEFLEVAFYTILHHGSLYPDQLFERRSKYGIPIYISRHPDLTGYVRDFLQAMRPSLEQDLVEEVSLNVRGEDRLVERFSFHLSSLLPTSTLVDVSQGHEPLQHGPSAMELEARYRACLSSLYRCFRVGMDNTPADQGELNGQTWSLGLHLRRPMLPLTDGSDRLPWIPEGEEEGCEVSHERSKPE